MTSDNDMEMCVAFFFNYKCSVLFGGVKEAKWGKGYTFILRIVGEGCFGGETFR